MDWDLKKTNSKMGRDVLVQRAAQERLERERIRKRELASVVLQAWWRGMKAGLSLRDSQMRVFEARLQGDKLCLDYDLVSILNSSYGT